MEAVLKQIETTIRKGLVPFLVAKLADENGVKLEETVVQAYVSEWLGTPASPAKRARKPKAEASAVVEATSPVDGDLSKLTLKLLQAMCKERSLVSSGTKATLIERLMAKPAERKQPKSKEFVSSDTDIADEEPASVVENGARKRRGDTNKSPTESDDDKTKRRQTKSVKKKVKTKPVVIEKIEPEHVVTETDEYGVVYDPKTGFVFNEDDEVVGKRDERGSVTPLTKEDFETCKRTGFPYKVPYNLSEDEA